MNIYNKDQMDRLADSRIAVECNGDPALYKLWFKKCDNCGLIWDVNIDMHYIDGSNNTVIFCTVCANNHYSELDRRQRDKWLNRRLYESD